MAYFTEYTWLVVIASIVLIIMAFAIGANDVGNAFATSVGSRCLSMRHALLICAVMEFVGALALGGNVTNTIAQGIVDLRVFARTPGILMYGMLCSISSATIVCLVATLWELPVSTAHSVVASVVAFGLVYDGPSAVVWYQRVDYYPYFEGVAPVLAGWLLSPFVAALVAGLLFVIVRSAVLRRPHSLQISYWMLPVLVLITIFVNVFFILYKDRGMTYSLGFSVWQVAWIAAVCAAGASFLTGLLVVPLLKRSVQHHVERRSQVRSQQQFESAYRRATALNPFQSSHRSNSMQQQDSSVVNGMYTLTLPSSPSSRVSPTSGAQSVQTQELVEKLNGGMSVDKTVTVRRSKDSSNHLSLLALDWANPDRPGMVTDLTLSLSDMSDPMRQSSDGTGRGPLTGRKNVSFDSPQDIHHNPSWHGPHSHNRVSPPGIPPHRSRSEGKLSRMDTDMSLDISRHGSDVDDSLNRLKPTSKSSPFAAIAAADFKKMQNGGDGQIELVVANEQPGKATSAKPDPIMEVSQELSHMSSTTSTKPAAGAFNWEAVDALAEQAEEEQECAGHGRISKHTTISEASQTQTTVGSSIRNFLFNLAAKLLMIPARPTNSGISVRSPSGRLVQPASTKRDSWCMQLLWFDVLQRTWVEVRTGADPEGGQPRTWLGRAVHGFWYAINYDVHDLIAQEADTRDLHVNAEHFDPDTEQTFKLVQVFTASVAAFSHGANDLANTIGPFAAIWAVYTVKRVDDNTTSPMWAIALAAAGIVLGLAACGYKIIGVLGVKSVAITPSRGFTIELSTALIIALGSHFGIPLSTTHCQVGGTGGVGLAEGSWQGVNARQFRRFFWAWLGSIVFAGLLSAALFVQGTSAPTLRIAEQVTSLEDTVVAKTLNIYCMLNYTNYQPGPGPTNSTLDYLIHAGVSSVNTTGAQSLMAANDNGNVSFQVNKLSDFKLLLNNAMFLLKEVGQLASGSIDACLS